MTLAEALRNANVRAFLRVIRERESSQDDSAYTIINGGSHFASFADHPFAGMSTANGGRAAGAYQFIPSTWAEVSKQYGLTDFSPPNQDLGAVARLVYRGALEDVLAGRIEAAIAKCRLEWTSLPGASESSSAWTTIKALAAYQQWGGHFAPERHPDTQPHPQPETAMPLPILALISAFGPLISQLIPQVSKVFDGDAKTPDKLAAATAVIDTVVKATGAPNLQTALEQVQANPEVKQKVTEAVVTQPEIIGALQIGEFGGGITAAREADLAQRPPESPFWKSSAVFWVSVLLMPLVYWLVGSLIVGGVPLPDEAPWWVKTFVSLFGVAWTGEARSGGFNLVVGLVLGGICGVYYGVSVTQAKQQQQQQNADKPSA